MPTARRAEGRRRTDIGDRGDVNGRRRTTALSSSHVGAGSKRTALDRNSEDGIEREQELTLYSAGLNNCSQVASLFQASLGKSSKLQHM